MALQKSFERKDGTIGDYWRITSLDFGKPNMDTKTVDINVSLALYKSLLDKQSGKTSMGETVGMAISVDLSMVASFIYNRAKTTLTSTQKAGDTPFFSGATDI